MSNDKGKVYMPISWHHDTAERGDFVYRHMNVNMDRREGAETKKIKILKTSAPDLAFENTDPPDKTCPLK